MSDRAYTYLYNMWGLPLDNDEDDWGLNFYGLTIEDVDGEEHEKDHNTIGTLETNPA